MENIQSLQQYGLNEGEAKVYIYLLKKPLGALGESFNTAFAIFANTKIPRATVYLILDTLKEKHLVSSYKKNNVLHFLAENPARLKNDLEEKVSSLNDLIPRLMALKNSGDKESDVRTYTGREGVKLVFDDVYDNPHLKDIQEFHTISNPRLIEYLPKYIGKVLDYKKKIDVKTKMIIPWREESDIPKEYLPDSHRDTRLLPKGFTFDGTIIIYGKKVALFSHKEGELYSIIVDSPTITAMLDALFMCLWQFTEK